MTAKSPGVRYLPFADGKFRLTMGLMPLDEAGWLEIDDGFAATLATKRDLLATRPAEVFAALPEAQGPAEELLDHLAGHLPRHHPTVYTRDGDVLHNSRTDERWNVAQPALHPLDLCGRLVQEDFCLLEAAGESHRLIGASLCAPARWRLADKLRKPLAAIHAPVPGFGERLARPVDRFFFLLRPESPMWRLNWGINDDPTPFQPEHLPAAGPVTADNAGERLWLRVERQTLRRLPQTGTTVFGIRTHITPLGVAIADAATAASLASALREMPPAMQAYKSIAPVAAALLTWLDRRAQA